MIDDKHVDDWPGVEGTAEVIRAYERAPQLKPGNAQTLFNYGAAFMELGIGLEKQASDAFKTTARLRPFWPAAHAQLGLAHASASRREALDFYHQAITPQPDDTNTLAALAHASLLLSRYEETEQAARQMIAVAPLTTVPRWTLGMAQPLQCRYADADESLHHAISLEPELAEACYGVGLIVIASARAVCYRFNTNDWLNLTKDWQQNCSSPISRRRRWLVIYWGGPLM